MRVDILLKGGAVIDGTGRPAVFADVAVSGDQIIAVGTGLDIEATDTIDCGGLTIAPGFIDVHTHHDEEVLSNPAMDCAVSQGVTTLINGNCGFSIAPLTRRAPHPAPLNAILPAGLNFADFAAYRNRLESEPPAVNTACLVGHGTLRIEVMDDLDRPATPDEIERMKALLRQSLESGALGLSSGTFYPPARAAPTEELIELSKVLVPFGALYVTHMRDEGDRVEEALAETFEIGRRAGVGVHISHHKCAGLANHGLSTRTLGMISEASRHQDVGLDVTPYVASATMLNSGRHRQASRVIVTASAPHPECAGRDLAVVAAEWGCSLDQAVARLLPALGIFFLMAEEDVRRILSYESAIVCSDAIAAGSHPHPRLWGTFPRAIGHYGRDIGLFPVETAIRKMTSLPADRFQIRDRGRVIAGAFADIVVFEADRLIDEATYEEPTRRARGIERVFVNGVSVYERGRPTGMRPGHFIAPDRLTR